MYEGKDRLGKARARAKAAMQRYKMARGYGPKCVKIVRTRVTGVACS